MTYGFQVVVYTYTRALKPYIQHTRSHSCGTASEISRLFSSRTCLQLIRPSRIEDSCGCMSQRKLVSGVLKNPLKSHVCFTMEIEKAQHLSGTNKTSRKQCW